MKIISIIRNLFKPASAVSAEERVQWLRDPLSHPALEAMSARELGDLPFGRACFER